jgi:hypothetical protein
MSGNYEDCDTEEYNEWLKGWRGWLYSFAAFIITVGVMIGVWYATK